MLHSITFVKATEEIRPHVDNGELRWTVPSGGAYLNERRTFEDWHLVPSSASAIAMPELKEFYLEVEGMDGNGIDLTDALSGRPLFKSREGALKFYRQAYDNWNVGIPDIGNWLHGQKIKMILDDDPLWYYEGRIQLSSIESNEYYATIEMKYVLEPYKKRVYASYDYDYDVLTEAVYGGVHIYPIVWDLIDFDEEFSSSYSHIIERGDSQTDVSGYFNIIGNARGTIPKLTIVSTSPTRVDPDMAILSPSSADVNIRRGTVTGDMLFASNGSWSNYEAFGLEAPANSAQTYYYVLKPTAKSLVILYRREKL